MKISLKWLQDYVEVQDYFNKPEALADLLTKAGLEVENIENRAKDFQFVVVGLILEKEKHPNADKLSLCKVTTGEGVVHQIVCGAQNHKANDRVVVALPGANLPGNFLIKNASVRGVESGGMLCSAKELGLAKESNGILILKDDAPIGKTFAEYMGYDDITFELKVTPNRADCLSHYGLAREVACLLSRPLKKLNPVFPVSEGSTQAEISVSVKDNELCPRYAGRFIGQVKIAASPLWLKQRLESVGLNSINNVVDITNYVMLELGQPLHAFDAANIEGRQIKVEKSNAGEKFKTLDGTDITLTGEELMIKDSSRNVAMAGVVGGQNSGVSESTQNLFLEAAYFLPAAVRKSSRKHGINTDSGYRFSRGVDPDNTVRAMDRAVELIVQIAGGVAYGNPHDIYPKPIKKSPVNISISTITDRLGYQADGKLFVDLMTRLGCKVESRSESDFQVMPPTYRFDIETDMDLVEEYARLHGYEHIPDAIPSMHLVPSTQDQQFVASFKISEGLRGQGIQQAINLAFVAEQNEKKFLGDLQLIKKLGLNVSDKSVSLVNPLSDDLNVMRSSLSYGLFRNMIYNFHQSNTAGKLFEIGKTFGLKTDGFQENWNLGIVQWGQSEGLWNKNQKIPMVLDLKSSIESLLKLFFIENFKWVQISRSEVPLFLHQGQAACLEVEGKRVGYLGALHPVLLDQEKIRVPVAIAEFDLEFLVKASNRVKRYEGISKFPPVERDLSLLMDQSLASAEVLGESKRLAGPLLVSANVFDMFTGEKLEMGKKSVSFRFKFQDRNATLQDQAVSDLMDKIVNGLKLKFGVSTR